jgi:glycosyltransferase involved in cell wall biosynthesis
VVSGVALPIGTAVVKRPNGSPGWPRSLHVGNVANVAYGYAKILARRGAPLDLICHDINHLMSQPEWDDLALDPKDFPDENDFRVNTADFADYRRPPWFRSGTLAVAPAVIRSPLLRRLASRLPPEAKRTLQPLYYRLRYLRERAARLRNARALARTDGASQADPGTERIRELSAMASQWGSEWKIDPIALACYLPHRDWLASHAASVDVIFSYALAPIYAALYARKPCVSVEIGTMRDFPLGSSAAARLLWLAYRLSDHIVITNPDDRDAAERAGLRHYSFCPHPVDEAVFFPAEEPALRRQLQDKHAAETLLLAPARQNWRLKGNDKLLRGFAGALARGVNAALLIPGWGQEIARSKELCRSLGIESRVAWLQPMPEPLLARHYRAVDLVLDQFQLGVFGLIAPKAMACGATVLTSYERRHNAWCFPTDPPLVACATSEEISASITRLAADPTARHEIGAASRRWIEQYHSGAVVADRLRAAMDSAMTNFGARKPSR